MSDQIGERQAEALVQGYLESSLTEQESARLLSWLQQNPAKVDLILDGLRDDDFIRTVVAEWVTVSPEKSSSHVVQRPGFLQWFQMTFHSFCEHATATAAAAGTAFATICIVFGLWYFSPAVGAPVLAEVLGDGVLLERSHQSIPPVIGTRLHERDILSIDQGSTAVIRFAPEQTRIILLPGTEFKLSTLSRGKHFDLVSGKLEASVARQRPFHPMIVKTPHAEGRVIGTRFTLTVSSSATRLDVAEGKVRFTRTSDLSSVRVAMGHYALAGTNCILAALPSTGSITRQWWMGIAGNNINALRDNARFPGHPDGSDLARSIELVPVQTNQFGMRYCGWVHPPITGDYEFWLTGATDAELFMSPNEDPAQKVAIAQIRLGLPGSLDQPRFRGGSNWAPPVPLVAGRIYYIEAIVLIKKGEGHLAVAWKPPGRERTILTGKFLSPIGTGK